MAKQTRRHFLRITALSGAGLVFGCDRPPGLVGVEEDGGTMMQDELDGGALGEDAGVVDAGQPLPPDEPETIAEAFNFPLGLASGDLEPTRGVLWTRYDGMATLRLRVWRMEANIYAERVADMLVTPGDGGFVHLDVAGLMPGQKYRYAFFEENAQGQLGSRSAIGRFRAALAPGQKEPIILGACSCTQQGNTPSPLRRAGERDDLDLFMLLGDTSYNDGADTISEYRARWASNLGSPEYRALRASTSVLATWDDHEVTNDFNPETIDSAKFATARKSYFESLPLRRHDTEPDRLWKSMKWGDTAEIFVLDTRGERKPSTRFNGQPHQYLSPAQMDWFKTSLKASTAVFKVIMNSVPITDFGFSAFTGDSWLSYTQQRTEILGWVESENIEGVLWVSGDHHFASVGQVSAFGVGREAIEILAGPGAQGANPVWGLLRPPRWDYATGTNNYVTIALDPMTKVCRLAFHNGTGTELFGKEYTL
jgi:alkaline phosphatase D